MNYFNPAMASNFGDVAQTYAVKSGDTLSKIAARFGVTVAAIASANGISNVNQIRVGQVLTIPGVGISVSPGPIAPVSPGPISAPNTGQLFYTYTLPGIVFDNRVAGFKQTVTQTGSFADIQWTQLKGTGHASWSTIANAGGMLVYGQGDLVFTARVVIPATKAQLDALVDWAASQAGLTGFLSSSAQSTLSTAPVAPVTASTVAVAAIDPADPNAKKPFSLDDLFKDLFGGGIDFLGIKIPPIALLLGLGVGAAIVVKKLS